jgi:release factor glutamine methyltransferase
MDSKELLNHIRENLQRLYEHNEASSITFYLLEEILQKSKASILAGCSVSEIQLRKTELALTKLLKGEPLQYVLGHAWFLGRSFQVNKHVLIPRPETEELVMHIVDTLGKDFEGSIMDVGTGSGCIPISLSLALPKAKVYAIDISPNGLEVAKRNAQMLGANVRFSECDILQSLPDAGPFDLIVSNPPYIPATELTQIEPNVVNFEPHLALFVEEPLVFYQRLADISPQLIKNGGQLWVETHYLYAQAVADYFSSKGLYQIKIFEDLSGKERMVSARKD